MRFRGPGPKDSSLDPFLMSIIVGGSIILFAIKHIGYLIIGFIIVTIYNALVNKK